jgi:hypothetical protein
MDAQMPLEDCHGKGTRLQGGGGAGCTAHALALGCCCVVHQLAVSQRSLRSRLPFRPLQAVDPAQFAVVTRFAAVQATTPAPVANFVFRSDAWNGGYVRPGAQVLGSFTDSHFRIFFGDAVGGDMWSFGPGSARNWFSMDTTAARERGRCRASVVWLARHLLLAPAIGVGCSTSSGQTHLARPSSTPLCSHVLVAGGSPRQSVSIPGGKPGFAAAAQPHAVRQPCAAPGANPPLPQPHDLGPPAR